MVWGSPHFVCDFSRKMFLILYPTSTLNFVVWLFLLLETLGNMYIANVRFPGCDNKIFKINLIFLRDRTLSM